MISENVKFVGSLAVAILLTALGTSLAKASSEREGGSGSSSQQVAVDNNLKQITFRR